MERLSVKIPRELKQMLIAAARARKTSQAAIVREALESYLNQDKVKGAGSVLDLARDLVGSCEGPEDLSSNKKYMESYGIGNSRTDHPPLHLHEQAPAVAKLMDT